MNRVHEMLHTDYAYKNGIFGKGVCVAVIDSGICRHPDLVGKNRILKFRDFLYDRGQYYDDCGHGSHICGILGGTGTASGGLYRGIAPECSMVVGKVLNYRGEGEITEVLRALRWIRSEHKHLGIRIVNLSFGTGKDTAQEDIDQLMDEVEQVWNDGIVVVTAAGNGGPNYGSISAPGCCCATITVGAADDRIPVTVHGRKIQNYSGRGPAPHCIRKPDLVAPAGNIVSCGLAGGWYGSKRLYAVKSGTSMATPMVSGAIALLLSIHPQLTPEEVKECLWDCCVDLGRPEEEQGAGLLNVERLLSAHN